MMALHANAVAEDRAAGSAAGRIDRDDGDASYRAAQLRGQGVDQRALARAGRAGDADNQRRRHPADLAEARAPFSTAVARRASSSWSPDQSFSSCRAITSRWISLVPSPMVQSFTSR